MILFISRYWCSQNIKIVISIFFLFSLGQLYGQEINTKKRIIIDVGHGGNDPGAIGVNGIKEKEVVLRIAKEILHLNSTLFENRFDIYLTRYKDTFISLKDRGLLAKGLKAGLFISLHCNASRTNAKGLEVYAIRSSSNESRIKKSITIGLSILQECTQKLGFKERGIKFANFQVLRETRSICPAILVETGFVTNDAEADYYLNDNNIRAMALAIISGISKYYKL